MFQGRLQLKHYMPTCKIYFINIIDRKSSCTNCKTAPFVRLLFLFFWVTFDYAFFMLVLVIVLLRARK
jgi:hypothetical protein